MASASPPPGGDPGTGARSGVTTRVMGPLQRFLHTEHGSAALLLAAAAASLVWANIDGSSYSAVWGAEVSLSVGDWRLEDTVKDLTKSGLMALFFFVVGLEVKREVVEGALSDRRARVLPAFAALGGMAAPALIYLALNPGGPEAMGWGIPMATDIAFALGVLRLLGGRVPRQLIAFLLAVAVIDDIGAITVIAVAYTDQLSAVWLAAGVVGIAASAALWRSGVERVAPHVAICLAVWLAFYESGVSPTVAGIALGLLVPIRPTRRADGAPSPLHRAEYALHPWSAYLVLPVFALANAGVTIDGATVSAALDGRVAIGIAVALVAGNAVGIPLGSWIAVRLGLARLPDGVTWRDVWGVALLAGIGFTVSIFIATLAFEDPQLVDAAKLGILAGSVAAAAIGTAVLTIGRRGRMGTRGAGG